MSAKIGEIVDQSNLMGENYALEVSSPGIDRVLKKEADFIRFAGNRVKVSVFAPINGQRNFSGKLASVQSGQITIDYVTGKTVTIPIAAIARARLDPDTKA
jgi:ribosome maturation factor RimP